MINKIIYVLKFLRDLHPNFDGSYFTDAWLPVRLLKIPS